MISIREITLAIFALAFVSDARAQVLTVQSGDHTAFTRLVIPIGVERDWTLEQVSGQSWELSLNPDIEAFNISRVFDLIQRTRIASMSADNTLSFDLACSCDVQSYRFQEQYLVIDISDEANASVDIDETANTSVDLPDQGRGRQVARAEATLLLPDLTELLTQPNQPLNTPPLQSSFELYSGGGPVLPDQITEDPDTYSVEQPNPRLAEAAQVMAEQLARAAASGLLDASFGAAQTIADPVQSETTIEATPEHSSEFNRRESIDGIFFDDLPNNSIPIRAETSLDVRIDTTPILSDAPSIPGSCKLEPLEMESWAETDKFDQGLGELRQQLYDDRDILRLEGVIALAQHYLYFGFGAEANYWLEQIERPPSNLVEIAHILDRISETTFPAVDLPANCSDSELLWRYIADAVTATLSAGEVAALQRAFSTLPPSLRDLVGARLARRLAEDGHIGTARNIRDMIERGDRVDLTELRILDLELGFSPDASPQTTREAFAESLRDDGANPVSILASALSFDRMQGLLPTPDRLVAGDALLREHGSGVETDMLWQEILIGRAALGQIDAAMDMLADTRRSESVRAAALTRLILERVSVEDTAALLVLTYRYGADWRPEGSEGGRAQVQAIQTLEGAGLSRAAEILRNARQPLILPGQADERSEPSNEPSRAWLEGDWAEVVEERSDNHAEVSERLLALEVSPTVLSDQEITDLSELSSALDDTRRLRSDIIELLAQPELQ